MQGANSIFFEKVNRKTKSDDGTGKRSINSKKFVDQNKNARRQANRHIDKKMKVD